MPLSAMTVSEGSSSVYSSLLSLPAPTPSPSITSSPTRRVLRPLQSLRSRRTDDSLRSLSTAGSLALPFFRSLAPSPPPPAGRTTFSVPAVLGKRGYQAFVDSQEHFQYPNHYAALKKRCGWQPSSEVCHFLEQMVHDAHHDLKKQAGLYVSRHRNLHPSTHLFMNENKDETLHLRLDFVKTGGKITVAGFTHYDLGPNMHHGPGDRSFRAVHNSNMNGEFHKKICRCGDDDHRDSEHSKYEEAYYPHNGPFLSTRRRRNINNWLRNTQEARLQEKEIAAGEEDDGDDLAIIGKEEFDAGIVMNKIPDEAYENAEFVWAPSERNDWESSVGGLLSRLRDEKEEEEDDESEGFEIIAPEEYAAAVEARNGV